jgi:hypothetical protein
MSWLAKIVRALSPDCREAVRMQSDALDRPLSFSQRTGLRLHLLICKWCRRYARQIKFLRHVAHQSEDVHPLEQTLPVEARERIKQALNAGKNSPD